jgi:hypothetical protein
MAMQAVNFQKQLQQSDRISFDNRLLAKLLPILERSLAHARILLKLPRSFVFGNKNTVRYDSHPEEANCRELSDF